MVPRGDRSINRVTFRTVRKAFFFGMACASAIGSFAACVGDDPASAPPAPDGSPDTSTIADASDSASDAGFDAGATCNIDAPFTTVERVTEFSTSNGDYGLAFSGDGLSAYVATGTGSQAIFVHTRLSTDAPFGGPIPLNGLPSDAHNYSPTITPDGKELFFAHRTIATGATDIYRAEIG
jgi:Tol biopolymer transport system component